jgi:malonyl-CoA O-methyltransferase
LNAPDRRAVARAFRRAARGLPASGFLYAEIRARLLERLELVRLSPEVVLDLGCGKSEAGAALATRFPRARIVAIDLVPVDTGPGIAGDASFICADATRLPLPTASTDLAFSSLMLPWCAPEAVFSEVRRVLRFPALFSFATFGPDTFRELRAAWAAVDRLSHVQDFEDMHNLGDALVRSGFAEPVVDSETLTVTYDNVSRLAAELQAMGASNLAAGRSRSLTGRRAWARMAAAYEGLRRPDGRLPLTIEVIYGQAWAPEPRGAGSEAAREIAVPVGRIGRGRRL